MHLCKNLASGKLNSNISASTTSISVYVGNGSSSTVADVWPTTPFYATIMPSNPAAGVPNSLDSEVVEVTDVTGGASGNVTMTIVRGQKGVAAKAFTAGSIVSHAIYAEEAVLSDDTMSPEPETPWITASMIDESTFRQVVTSSSGSITIPAGKWLILHTFNIHQTSSSAGAVFSYNLGNADAANDTWAVPSTTGQNFSTVLYRMSVKSFSAETTCTVASHTATNITTDKQSWVVVPIL